MSRSSRTSKDPAANQIQLMVLRSSGEKDEIVLSPSDSLQVLKDAISQSKSLGRIPSNDQRLFHLGRELKTSGRSLEALGVTRFGFHVLHVHTTRPPRRRDDDENDDDDDIVEVLDNTPQRRQPNNEDSGEEQDDDDDDEVEVIEVRQLNVEKQVIDLADSDDEQDGEEQRPETAIPPPRKRQRL